jgi:hypothetical protein
VWGMDEKEDPQEGIETGAETSDYGERPESPDAGHPVGETTPSGGVEPGTHEHPEDVRQPSDEERDETSTESPAPPADQSDD